MKEIGGYFGLELRQGEPYHKYALALNTARNSLEYILQAKKYEKIYIPYYTCDVILEPINKLNVEYEFYSLNHQLEPVEKHNLRDFDAFLYTNYFGLKQNCIEGLAKIYKEQLIIDNAQAFFSKPIKDIDTFYSPRKFFGVSDGGYLYINNKVNIELEQDYSYERMAHLLARIDVSAEFGYNDFKMNDASLINNPIKRMSNLTSKILSSIDYNHVKLKRRENYLFLHSELKDRNLLRFEIDDETIPMVYPFFVKNGLELKKKLIKNKIYIASYWQNVLEWTKSNSLEYNLVNNLLPLPIDQQYNVEDLKRITESLNEY